MFDDSLIIQKIKEGDVKAFEQLFNYYYPFLCWYSSGIIGQTEPAKEIVGELFYKLWKNKEHFPISKSLSCYLYKSVYYQSLQYRRQQVLKDKFIEYSINKPSICSIDPHQYVEYHELEEVLRIGLAKLPNRRQKIFNLHRMEGKKYSEIANQLSLSVKTIEAEMTKALKTLREEFDNYV